jgi:glyceraldehyde 3-phosphate dehydrogenase
MGKGAAMKLGINGFGRIGKLTLWHHVSKKYFREIVVNTGREAGTSFADLIHYIVRDSTYGSLPMYLYGCQAGEVIQDVDDSTGTMTIDGVKITFLKKARDPREIEWKNHNVELVVDTTGQFLDPTLSADAPKGSIRGHLEAGAGRVIVSAPLKIKDKLKAMPNDAVTCVRGINEHDYDPACHRIISGASCTTTCLAHMIKPLLDVIGAKRILTASMATVHAATGVAAGSDRMAKPGAMTSEKQEYTE